MDNFQRKTMSFLENCNLTWLEKKLVLDLGPIVTEVTKNFWLKHCNGGELLDDKITAIQIVVYKRKIDSLIEMLENCDKFLKNYPSWAKQRKETIGLLRKVETNLKNIVMKCHPILKALGPKAQAMFPNFLINLFKPSGIHTEAEKKALTDLKSEVEENRNKALKMCSLDFNLLHELGACEFYDRAVDSINDLFGDEISHEILDDLLKFLKNFPKEDIGNVENINTELRTCLESILPKISNLLSKGFSISCTILSIFLVMFMSRRQSGTILIYRQDLGIKNSVETEVAELIAASRVKGSKLEKIISSEMKKTDFGEVDDAAIILKVATIILNSIDVNDGFLIPETRLIVEIANKLEKDYNSYQKAYEMLEKSSKERLKMQDISNWTTVIIFHIPKGTGQTAIKNVIKTLIRKKAHDFIDLKRLPTNGNNWLVKVPTFYSQTLLKEKFIDIAKERCLVML